MKILIILIMTIGAQLAEASDRADFDRRAKESIVSGDGKLMAIPKTAIICTTRQKAIDLHNLIVSSHDGNYDSVLVRRLSRSCYVSGHVSAGFIVETVEGSSFVKMEYTVTRSHLKTEWFYLPALSTWAEHLRSETKIK